MTGLSEKSALAAAYPAKAVIIHRTDLDAYFQDARPLCLKVVYHADTGMILGAQAFGENGVDKRIDVLATAVQAGMTVKQLAELDLSYAPPFNSANDPINYAGMVASNNLTGFARSVSPTEFLRIFDIHQDLVLDVAARILAMNGFHDVVNISGGWASLRHFFPLPELHAHH